MRSDWFMDEATEDDEHSGALVEDLIRKLRAGKVFMFLLAPLLVLRCAFQHLTCRILHAEHVARDVAFEASKPGYGVWLRLDAHRNPSAALASIGRAACRRPWYVLSIMPGMVYY